MTEVSKDTLRQEAIRHRDRINPAGDEGEQACVSFFESLVPQPEQVVALYWPKGREFDPGAIAQKLMDEGFTCALPVVMKDEKILKFARWDNDAPLVPGAFGIMQPANPDWIEPDIVVVPLLAFDRRGYRLGFGGGYYDATLRALRAGKKITAVGLAYAEQAVLFNLPVEPHDEKLDWVITPQRVYNHTKTGI